jgi:hypothetical protein
MCQQETYSFDTLQEETRRGKDVQESEPADQQQFAAEGRTQPEELSEDNVSKRSYAAALAKKSSEKRKANANAKQEDLKDEKLNPKAVNSSGERSSSLSSQETDLKLTEVTSEEEQSGGDDGAAGDEEEKGSTAVLGGGELHDVDKDTAEAPKEAATSKVTGSRDLLLYNMPPNLFDADICNLAGAYGAVRAIDSSGRMSGYVAISFYDLRHAILAAEGLTGHGDQPSPVLFSVAYAVCSSINDGLSYDGLTVQGASLDETELHQTLRAFGEINAMTKIEEYSDGQSCTVEYFDLRDACKAFESLSSSKKKPFVVTPALCQEQAPLYPHCAWPPAMNCYPQGAVTSSVECNTYNQQTYMMGMSINCNQLESGQQQDYWMNPYSTANHQQMSMQHGAGAFNHTAATQFGVPTSSAAVNFAPQGYYPYYGPHSGGGSFVQSNQDTSRRLNGTGKQRYSSHMKKDHQSNKAGRYDGARGKARSYYNFNVEEARAGESDARTTIMIKNIPNKYDQTMLLKVLDTKYKGMYDFFYLPIDFRNRCNLGYAFVNFVNSSDAADLYEEFHLHKWSDFNSKKVCEVTYARVQGQNALLEHFKNSKFPDDDKSCLPLVIERLGTSVDGEPNTRALPIRTLSSDTVMVVLGGEHGKGRSMDIDGSKEGEKGVK